MSTVPDGGPTAAAVERGAEMAPGPSVQKPVCGSGVESDELALRSAGRGKDRDVRDAAQIDDYPVARGVGQRGFMKHGRQGGALSTGRNVPSPEIGDGRDSRSFRDDVGVADLRGERPAVLGLVSNRLSVAANRDDVPGRNAACLERTEGSVGEDAADLDVEPCYAIEGRSAARRDGEQVALQAAWNGMTVGPGKAHGFGVGVKRRDRGVDFIDARAGNEPEEVLRQRLLGIQAREPRAAENIQPSFQRSGFPPEPGHLGLAERRRAGQLQLQRVPMHAVDAELVVQVRARWKCRSSRRNR